MPYVKGVWVDEVLTEDARYNILQDGGTPINNDVQIVLETPVATPGTALTAARMNNIETGLETVDIRSAFNLADSKATPIDGDKIGLWDSIASLYKYVSWLNLKATLKTYFDTFYSVLAHDHAALYSLLTHDHSATNAIDNVLINPDFLIWQRGTSFLSAISATKLADKFKYLKSSTGVHDITRDTDVPTLAQSGHKSTYSIKLDVTTIDASIAATDFCGFLTTIEGYDYAAIKDKTVTLSFWVKAVKTGIYCVTFRNNVNDRSYIAEYTISAASTWEKKTITLILNQSGGTEDYTFGAGLTIFWTMMCGTTYHTTANAWQTGNFISTVNQVNSLDNVANNFWLSQVKFEQSAIPTLFTSRLFVEELQLCKKYFFKTFQYGTVPAANIGPTEGFRWPAIGAGAITHRPNSFFFPVQMRIAPTITFYNPGAAASIEARDYQASANLSGTSVGTISDSFININATGNAATALGNAIIVCFTADAEF